MTLILVSALLFRLIGINNGLPYLYHPDEPFSVRVIQHIFKMGDLNPHYFYYPSMFFYLNALGYTPYYFIGRIEGKFISRADIPEPQIITTGTGYIRKPSVFILGRLLSVLVGIALVLLVYSISRKLSNQDTVALFAAFAVACSPNLVIYSHFITPDIYATFFSLLAFGFSVLVFREGKTWQYLITGLAIGWAISTKYNVAPIATTYVAAHLLRTGWAGLHERRFYFGLGVIPLGFLIVTPYSLLDYKTFLEQVTNITGHYAFGILGNRGANVGGSFTAYLIGLWQLEGPILLASMGGCLLAFVKRSRSLILASVFPIIYFGFISIMSVHTNQTIAPLVPFLHILGTWFLVEAIRSVLKFSLPYKYVALALLFAYLILSYTYMGITLSKWLDSIVTINSRETSRLWIEKNIPSGSRIALEPYSPYIPPDVYNLFPIARIIDHPLEWYKESKIEYVIFSQGMYKRYFNEPAKYSEYVKQYRAFFQTFRIVKIFNDGNYEIRIYTP